MGPVSRDAGPIQVVHPPDRASGPIERGTQPSIASALQSHRHGSTSIGTACHDADLGNIGLWMADMNRAHEFGTSNSCGASSKIARLRLVPSFQASIDLRNHPTGQLHHRAFRRHDLEDGLCQSPSPWRHARWWLVGGHHGDARDRRQPVGKAELQR